jgi:hypothetical protein
MSKIYDVMDRWGLSDSNFNIELYTKSDLQKIAMEIQLSYVNVSHNQELGRGHLGITESVHYMENGIPLSTVALPLLTFKQLWMPDPLYSLLSYDSIDSWEMMPDSGGKYFTALPGPTVSWRNYWRSPKEQRIDRLKSALSAILPMMNALRELVQDGVVIFYPWELLVRKNYRNMREASDILNEKGLTEIIATRYPQEQYNLGVRVGSIGIKSGPGPQGMGLKPGTNMWFKDKTPVLVCGILNTMLSDNFGANFIPSLPGDRIVHDYVRSGGYDNPVSSPISNMVKMPKLSNAVWEDIVAIRRDSETLSELRVILKDSESVEEQHALDSIRERLEKFQERMRNDTSLWKVVKEDSIGFTITALGGFLSSIAGGTNVPLSVASGTAGAGLGFLWQLYSGLKNPKYLEAKKRIDVMTRIIDKVN